MAYLKSQPKEFPADLAFVNGKSKVVPMRHLPLPRLDLHAVVMAPRFKEQIVREHEKKLRCRSFWADSTTVLQWMHSFHWKKQGFGG